MNFELEMEHGEFVFNYKLRVVPKSNIAMEVLTRNGKLIMDTETLSTGEHSNSHDASPLFLKVAVFDEEAEEWIDFRVADVDNSVVGQYQKQFNEALAQVVFVKFNPFSTEEIVEETQSRPSRGFSNFAAYYSHVLQEKSDEVFELTLALREVIPHFRSLVLEDQGLQKRKLRVEFAFENTREKQKVRYNFNELSEGQRALIALYTLVYCESNSAILVDEPENFIALRELQPLIAHWQNRFEETEGQAVFISHHPEFINWMAPQNAVKCFRQNGGPVQIREFDLGEYEGLTPAEIVARGWDNE